MPTDLEAQEKAFARIKELGVPWEGILTLTMTTLTLGKLKGLSHKDIHMAARLLLLLPEEKVLDNEEMVNMSLGAILQEYDKGGVS